jgi:hypothetical protein
VVIIHQNYAATQVYKTASMLLFPFYHGQLENNTDIREEKTEEKVSDLESKVDDLEATLNNHDIN